jgi:hypothetical protein
MEEEPSPAPPKRERRCYQFSLRTLLIFVVIVAIPCGWLGRKIVARSIDAFSLWKETADEAIDFRIIAFWVAVRNRGPGYGGDRREWRFRGCTDWTAVPIF